MNLLSYVHLRNIYGSTGAGRVARQLTEHIARGANVNMHVLADAGDHRSVVDKVGPPWTGYSYHLFNRDTSGQQARWLFTHRPTAESFWPDVDIVHCTMESYVPSKHSRLVATVHDAAYFEPDVHAASWSTRTQRFKWRILYATLARSADLFHTVSHFSADRLATFFPSIRDRLRVVYNAAPERFHQPPSGEGNAYLTKAGLSDTAYVLVPGGLSYRKNAPLVLDVWPRLHREFPELKLVVTGHSQREFAERASSFESSVFLTGYVDDECLCSLYHAARVVWFPSRYEGFGIPILEAMACGTPVVASDASSVPEVAGGAALLAAPDASLGHLDLLHAIIRDRRLSLELSRKGRERAAQFTWSASAQQLCGLFQTLL